jgi:small GTP-binding protein
MATIDNRRSFKFIVIGNNGVGKTAILKRLIDDVFIPEGQTTIGVEFLASSVEIDGQSIKLQIWDTAGQERFRSIAKAYFRSAMGVILVFDLTERKSFDDLNRWLSDIHQLCDPNAVTTLIGNKLDVKNRAITTTEAEAFSQLHQLSYFETSALGGDNIQEAFHRTATAILRKSPGTPSTPTTAVVKTGPEPKSEGCC